ncbi:serpin 28Dc [Haematobia irritans]|uniref:Putative serine protease inhibitor n=2 Tax=Haematobia irritans TaxID=7368 RepID=A0A1L8EIJ1_HAEIR
MMSILNNFIFIFALLVFGQINKTQAAGNDLHVQINSNPLNVGNGQNMGSPIFSPYPIPTSQSSTFPTKPVFQSTPVFSSSSANGFTPPSLVNSQSEIIDAEVIAENVLQFGHDIAQQINQLDPYAAQSEVFSPLSIMSALSLLMLGSRGKSYQELKKLIGLDKSPELERNPSKYHELFGSMLYDMENFDVNALNAASLERNHPKWRYSMNTNSRGVSNTGKPDNILHTINVANGLFVQTGYSLNPDYSQVVSSIYDSQLTQLDFGRKSSEAVKYINNWVNESTRGKIKDIITNDISSTTKIVLASVLYFRGLWETPFFPRSTKEENFYPDGTSSPPIRANFMATGGVFPYYDAKEYDCRIIGLPYRGNETTMYVIQPNSSTRLKLQGLMSVLDARKINEMIDKMVFKTTVMLFPKMHFVRKMNVEKILRHMGVSDIFNVVQSDLSLIGVGPSRSNPVSKVSESASKPIFTTSPVFAPILNVFAQAPERTGDRGKGKPFKTQFYDRYNEPALTFSSRFGEIETNSTVPVTESSPEMQHSIEKRQTLNTLNAQALANLEIDRFKQDTYRSDLFVDEIVHKVDIAIDEQGTEAAAATAAYLHRSGTDVVFRGDAPFLFVIRHDATKLPLFYGVINKPEL